MKDTEVLEERLQRAYRAARPKGRPGTAFLNPRYEEAALRSFRYVVDQQGQEHMHGWRLVFTEHEPDVTYWIERYDPASLPQRTRVIWHEVPA